MVTGSLAFYGGIRYREGTREPSVLLFCVMMGTAAVWALFHAGELMSTTRSSMILGRRLTQIPAYVVPIAWLLFMLYYTDRGELVTRRTVTAISVVPAIAVVLSLFAPDFIWLEMPTRTYRGRMVLEATISPLGLFFYTYSYLLAGAGVLLAGQLVARGEFQHQRQGMALALAAAVSTLASVVYISGRFPHPSLDLAPPSFAISGSLLAYAIFRYDMLEFTPIAHRAAFETLPDVVAVFDADWQIVDVNPAGRRLCGVTGDPTGRPAKTVFSDYPPLIDKLFERQHIETETNLVVDGQLKHFSMLTRPVEFRDEHSGTLLILRDVTELKEREQDLELLKRIQSRVLRHNIRNDLQIIHGLARTIANAEDGQTGERAIQIVEQAKALSETTEKAQQIESVVDASDDRIDQDVCQVAEHVAEQARRQFPGAKVETDTPGTAWAVAHGDLEAAVWNLVENAVVHSDARTAAVEVRVETTDTTVTVLVDDNGPGIPDHEVDVLEQQSENALQHGSGAGLWLVNWIAEMSAGSLSFDTPGQGTTVHLELPAAEHALPGTDQQGVEEQAASSSTGE